MARIREEDNAEYWRKDLIKGINKPAKPIIPGLTDLGLALEPAEEAELRKFAADRGVDFDALKADFEADYQVIRPRKRGPLSDSLMEKGVIPKNELRLYFMGQISGRAYFQKCVAEWDARDQQKQ